MGGGLENPPPLKTFYQGNKKPMVRGRSDTHDPHPATLSTPLRACYEF